MHKKYTGIIRNEKKKGRNKLEVNKIKVEIR